LLQGDCHIPVSGLDLSLALSLPALPKGLAFILGAFAQRTVVERSGGGIEGIQAKRDRIYRVSLYSLTSGLPRIGVCLCLASTGTDEVDANLVWLLAPLD